MARRPRADVPGAWHHVINRAVAKRPYFEARSDHRYFLARLATEVRAGRLEVHAFCLMTTHFHLLVRSPKGELSEAMRRAQCAYSRFFNRRRRRDGPLIRARFFSKVVDTETYRRAIVRYIDANPVRAGVVTHAADYEFGSARRFVFGPRPRWLSSDWIVPGALALTGDASFDATSYLRAFGPSAGEDLDSLAKLVELRMASTSGLDPLEDVVGATPPEVREWMSRKARLADGMELGLPVCGPTAVRGALDRRLEARGEWFFDDDEGTWRGSHLAWSGLLRDLCSMPLTQIALTAGTTRWTATGCVARHHAAVAQGGEYAVAVAEIAHEALRATFPDSTMAGMVRHRVL